MNLRILMDPNAEFRQAARVRIVERAAVQQDRRAMKMSRKIGRGNRRAAKASVRAAALHDQAAIRRGSSGA